MGEELILKNVKSIGKQYNLVAGDKVNISVGETEVLKEKVPNEKKWLINISLYIEEEDI